MKKQVFLMIPLILWCWQSSIQADNTNVETVASKTENTGNNTCTLSLPFPGFPIDFQDSNADWIDYDLGGDFLLTANADGTMTISGTLNNAQAVDFGAGSNSVPCGADDEWMVNLTVSAKKTYTEWQGMGGQANIHANCAGMENGLEYWDVAGTLTGLGCNTGRTVNILGAQPTYQLQIGTGAMSTDGTCDFAVATWFDAEENGQAINADIYAFVDETCYNNLVFPPPVPAISVTDNDCPSNTAGMFNVDTDCSATSHIEWSVDNGANWSASPPSYDNNSSQTVITRCVDDNDASCVSANSNSVITSPNSCTTSTYDVAITKTVDNDLPNLNDTITFTLTLTNNNDAVTGATVTDVLPIGLNYANIHTASVGTFDGTTWTIGNLATGASETIDIAVVAVEEGVHTNTATVAVNETEDDLTNNEDEVCVSVPIEICDDGSQSIDVTGFDLNGDGTTLYQWYVSADSGTTYDSIPANNGGTAQTYNITQAGYYLYTVNDAELGNCGDQLCCPIIVETTTCVVCPPKNCIPIQIEKVN